MLRSAKKHTDKDELFTTNPASSTRLAADPPPRLFKVYATECTVGHIVQIRSAELLENCYNHKTS